ncbi:MAG: RdgB/HAM1 family non-canonical purine NTP pyrophosphatase, partial [Candidatus Heimdallarchaeota archaeon]|nr:RdgB/HAM1 family non-canonical purine NTP pyrophosphatase [Candidatus Heimdallarchaeota archaeon]
EISFVTSNKHKFEELSNFFSDGQIKFQHLKLQYPELQADTFKQIVISSASTLMTTISQPFLIEDSGLSISALQNFPGPYSSYVFQTLGWEGILDLMKNQTNQSAHFTSIFAYVIDDNIRVFEGVTKGMISFQGQGTGGFGFDPIFIPDFTDSDDNKNSKTYAELDIDLKNMVSHRGLSMKKLQKHLYM